MQILGTILDAQNDIAKAKTNIGITSASAISYVCNFSNVGHATSSVGVINVDNATNTLCPSNVAARLLITEVNVELQLANLSAMDLD
ncbi:hypothetical protein D9758_004325 [Tetrapyrgos nigripes]|uniref:Uncharacterized protein n=1 Tax=Tetrapyrgos nigripes TaxID=182062 RepID=A0A8H5LSM2_9AGAR|nr:hypothetical protein D9758_004325 [Tetrapyrgos nigripes]